jgi:N-carbamoyl-L-amino-acid hydrolase
MMGSGVFTGAVNKAESLDRVDRNGVRMGDALDAIGYAGNDTVTTELGAYFEAHIEQGPTLEAEDKLIGVVTGAMGQRWYNIRVQGMESHAGSTPMEIRRDALVVAAEIIQAVNRIALEQTPNGRGTVGCLDTFPNSRNVIPGRVGLTVDFRHACDEGLSRMDRALRDVCSAASRPGKIEIEVEQAVYFPPQQFAPGLVNSVRTAAGDRGYPHLDLASGAGHDAVYLARVTPTAMIFVPCKDGISHNEIEHAEPDHLTAGANVLLEVMLRQAGRSE